MSNQKKQEWIVSAVLSVALIFGSGASALGQDVLTVPVGTVIPMRMDTPLSSNSTRVGDPFTATVNGPVMVEGVVAVPEGARVEGHVTGVTSGERGRGAGTLAVSFDRIVLPSGNSIRIDATLTSLSEEGRRRIEQDLRYQDRAASAGQTRRAVVFIGTGANANAAIGVYRGSQNNATGLEAVIGVLLGTGQSVEVQPGTEFGMMLERSFSVEVDTPADRAFDNRDNGVQAQDVFSGADSIRAAQIALRERNYYKGPVTGTMNQATREAISNFQHDRNLTITGDLTIATVRALGIPVAPTDSQSQATFTSADSIRFAQITLRDRGYYTGPINGEMTFGTRNAIRQLQRDNNLPITGELDGRTARLLGIASESGLEGVSIEIVNPRAERVDRDSIRISMDVHTRGTGWQIFVNRFVTNNNTLHVYVRGVPPRYPSGTATDHHPFSETYNVPNIARVIVHGPQRDFAIDLLAGGGRGPGGTGIGNARQISFLANRLFQDFQRDLNIRRNGGQVIFDTRRNFRPSEVEILFQLNNLRAAAELYGQLSASVTDSDALKSAADSLLRQARLLTRVMNRDPQLVLSTIVRGDWDQLRTELARINVTDNNLDSDIIR
jgi:peptidoglycan hydrolase-like protein with peptidoglycan-binding domain